MNIQRSVDLFNKAKTVIPGGVNSPARAFRAVGGQPLFIERGEGAYLIDVDGNRFVDYVLSFGPLIRGHAHAEVVQALAATAVHGTSFGAPSPLEITLAELIISLMPNLEMVRFVNSGTEATMSALRLARAFTGRSKIIKFQGNYHGHADMLLVQAGSGVATLGLPDSPGVPAATVQDTLTAQFNNIDSVVRLFSQFPDQIAAIIVEPVAGNMGVVPPDADFLPALRQISQEAGALLVFDEVMTGFRVHVGGAQALYGVQPDITALGKVIGGGLPVGAYGGRREIMEWVAPAGPMYQAGTLSGNPLAMAAGIATLRPLQEEGVWQAIADTAVALADSIRQLAADAGVAVQVNQVGTMFTTFFSEQPIRDWETAAASDTQRFGRFHQALLAHGVYLPPSQFEACFLSTAHGPEEIGHSLRAFEAALTAVVN